MRYKINGETMPSNVTKFQVTSNDLYGEATGRSESGHNHLELVRANVRTWEVEHQMITRAEVDKITTALDPMGFDLEIMDTNGVTHAHCYGTTDGAVLQAYWGDLPDQSRWSITIHYIEN